jgi:hypothetical protein
MRSRTSATPAMRACMARPYFARCARGSANDRRDGRLTQSGRALGQERNSLRHGR